MPEIRMGSYTLEQSEEEVAALRGLVTDLDEAHTQSDSGTPPELPDPGSHTSFNSAGHHKYAADDGNSYNTGRLSMIGPPTDQLVTSLTAALIAGMSATVNPVTYRVSGKVACVQGGGAFAQLISLHGPAVTAMNVMGAYYLASSGISNGVGVLTALGDFIAPPFAPGSVFWLDMHGVISFSAAGLFSVQAAQNNSGHNFTVSALSHVDLMPVT